MPRPLILFIQDFYFLSPWKRLSFQVGTAKDWLHNCILRPQPTFQAVLQAVLHHHEELLQGGIVRVQGSPQVQSGFNQALDTQLCHVHQVHAFVSHEIIRICGKEMSLLSGKAHHETVPFHHSDVYIDGIKATLSKTAGDLS